MGQILTLVLALVAFGVEVTGVILAGGKSSRMGQDKGLMPYKEKPLVSYGLDVLKQFSSRQLIIANQPGYEGFGVEVIQDIEPELGPIGGIVTALENITTEKCCVLACDMPFVSAGLFQYLLQHAAKAPIVVPMFKERLQPLAGLYDVAAKSYFEHCLQQGQLKLTAAIESIDFLTVDIHPALPFYTRDLFRNFNRPTDLTL